MKYIKFSFVKKKNFSDIGKIGILEGDAGKRVLRGKIIFLFCTKKKRWPDMKL
jgi:hypothetical protein